MQTRVAARPALGTGEPFPKFGKVQVVSRNCESNLRTINPPRERATLGKDRLDPDGPNFSKCIAKIVYYDRELAKWFRKFNDERVELPCVIMSALPCRVPWTISPSLRREKIKREEGGKETYRVSIKSLYNFKNLSERRMKRQISGNYYKMRRIHLSSLCTIGCTKHVKTVLDFLPCSLWHTLINGGQWHQWSSALDQWCPVSLFDTRYLQHNPMWVSLKSLYNIKNLLQRRLMRYLRQICSMYSVVIKVFIALHFAYLVDE